MYAKDAVCFAFRAPVGTERFFREHHIASESGSLLCGELQEADKEAGGVSMGKDHQLQENQRVLPTSDRGDTPRGRTEEAMRGDAESCKCTEHFGGDTDQGRTSV